MPATCENPNSLNDKMLTIYEKMARHQPWLTTVHFS